MPQPEFDGFNTDGVSIDAVELAGTPVVTEDGSAQRFGSDESVTEDDVK